MTSERLHEIAVVSTKYFIRQGLSEILKPLSQYVVSSRTVAELAELSASLMNRGVVIIDCAGLDAASWTALNAIAEARNFLYILMGNDPHVLSAVERVHGFVPDDAEPELIISLVLLVQQGYQVFPSGLPGRDDPKPASRSSEPKTFTKRDVDLRIARLSPRETEVLHLIGQGFGSKRMAHLLRISDTTVRLHTRSVIQKLGVENRTQAALIAITIDAPALN